MATRDVFRELQSGYTRVTCSDWRILDQDAPSTVPTSKPTTFNPMFKSDTADSFDGSAGGKKLLVKFTEPIASRTGYRNNLLWTFAGNTNTTLQARTVVTFSDAASHRATLIPRFRFITADFDASTITWTNHSSSLTFGATHSIVIASATNTGTCPIGNSLTCDTLLWTLHGFITTGGLTIYGFVFDAKGQVTGTPSSFSCSHVIMSTAATGPEGVFYQQQAGT